MLSKQIRVILMAVYMMECKGVDPCEENANGCSIPSWVIATRYNEEFQPACNRHDICYACAMKFNISKIICDDDFKDSMLDICREQSWYHFIGCRIVAYAYYLAVSVSVLAYEKFNTGPEFPIFCDYLKDVCLPST